MKLTPLDIRKQEFEKSLRGYDPSEVRNFLGIVATQWEEIADERRRLEDKVGDLQNKLEHYERVEEALQEALQTARENAEDKIKNAEREAELIVGEAKAEAREIRQEAKEERDQLQRRTQRIDDRRGEIVARLRSFLMAEMELLARFEGDDPIGFIKLLPTEERKKLREAGVDLEQISPHFEEVGEPDTDAQDPGAGDTDSAALDEELFGEDAPASSSSGDDEPRMTREEEDELSAFFEEFASGDASEPPDEAEDTASSALGAEPSTVDVDDEAGEPIPQPPADPLSEFAPPEEGRSKQEDVSAHEPTDEDMESMGEGWASGGGESSFNLDEIATSDQPHDQQRDEPEPEASEDEFATKPPEPLAPESSSAPEPSAPAEDSAPRSEFKDSSAETSIEDPDPSSAASPPDRFDEPPVSDEDEPTTSLGVEPVDDELGESAPAFSEPEQGGGPESQPEMETRDADEASEEPQRDFRVNALFSADPDPAPSSDAPSSDAPSSANAPAASPTDDAGENADDARAQDDERENDRASSPSEEIERIRRILKNME